ncbi:MAG: cytochrome c [Gammaproteobacteria bacterium]|nr:cytochrome c [Gammaproteobacteria bacterium]MDH5802454.1 cytochrome c [Gammaproteobacteria bacterium]
MKRGEVIILAVIGVSVLIGAGLKTLSMSKDTQPDRGIPFYSTAAKEQESQALLLMRKLDCRRCHAYGGLKNIMQSVPAPALDGIGSIREESWFYKYFSAENPQAVLPSRLKKEFQMPSYAGLDESDRRLLAMYMDSLKVEDWYLEQARKSEHEKLTGTPYQP